MDADVGIATGLKSWACLIVETAREQGLISVTEINQILAAAAN